jgi:hypothetical protein
MWPILPFMSGIYESKSGRMGGISFGKDDMSPTSTYGKSVDFQVYREVTDYIT